MRFNSIITAFILVAFNSALYAQGPKFQLLIGSSANSEKTDGIYIYEFDSESGAMTLKNKVPVSKPSYFAASDDLKYIYSITEGVNISSYNYDRASAGLTFLNKQGSGGAGPIHISVDHSGRYVFAANYDGGSLTALPVQDNGSLQPVVQTIMHEGNSIDKVRQTKPYVHTVMLTPDNRYLIATDLGTDQVNSYRFDKKSISEPLDPAARQLIAVKPGSGPRFFTFHPNKKYAYMVHEMGGMITAFNYNSGSLKTLQTISMLSEGFTGRSGAADIHVSPDGKFLYASNRGDANELVIYSINQKNGELTFAGRYPSSLKSPRYFAIDPSGNFLLLTNQGSDNITVLKRDNKTGLLTATGQKPVISKPVCLLFTGK